ncbi:MAG: hypothetical protein DRG59_13545, partial [Deltaproteobacteria bacterium]
MGADVEKYFLSPGCALCILLIMQVFLTFFCVFPARRALAQETQVSTDTQEKAETSSEEYPLFKMDEMVITATREPDIIKKVPKNVSVITAEDIAMAPSNSIVDLLSREASLNLRSMFGNDKKAGLDIRGMGDTYVSNVIVMVDGFKLNPPDMAGADFSTIPLDQVERIEIVRGAGSVLYGNGAVGGVINI